MATQQPANQTKTPTYTPTPHIFNQSEVTFAILLYILMETESCYLELLKLKK